MPNYISAIKLPSGDVYQIKDSGALRLTGGQVTGPVNFGDSVYISDLNAGTLIVTGNAAFTNNIQANTINGVEVGSNPKFTDTTYTFDGTYNASTNKAATVNTVTNAINNLDGNLNNTTPGVGKTLTAFGQTNGKVSATFGDISITKSQISDFPTSWALSAISGADDLKKIEALTGTTGFLKKTNTNTWSLDTNTYLTAATLPTAANDTLGGIKIGYTTSGKKYPVQLDSNSKAYVQVPWADNNTTYTAGTGLNLSGTTFNHSNSITAGTAGTSSTTSSTNRQIAIPYITYDAQGHITASGTHTHTIESFPEAYLTWGGKNFSASYGPIDAAMIPQLGANRFAFLKPAGIEIEYSTDGGESWNDYAATNDQKVGLFSTSGAFYLGKAATKENNNINNMLRVTITTNLASIYTTLNKIAIYMSTQGNTVWVKIERATQAAPTNYITHLDWTQISGWSGWNILNISGLTTYGNTSSQNQKVRFVFKQTSVSANYSSSGIWCIYGFGGVGWTVPSNMAKNGHLYSYDSNQNATFPAQITATQFNGNATSATSASFLINKTLDSSTIDRTAGSFTFQGSAAPWAGTDWVGLQIDSGSDKFQIHALSSTTLQYRQNDSGGTNSNWSDWQSLLSSGNYTDYTVTKTGTGASGSWGIDITGNADTATSATKDSSGNVISDTYLKLSGGTMTGGITFENTSNAWNTKGVLFSKGSRIGEDTSGVLGIYGKKIVIRPDSLTQNSSDGVEITGSGLYPSNNNSEELGSSSKKWSNVYATTFVGDLNGSAKKLAQVDNITALNDFIDSTYLIYIAKGGSNTIANKPSGVDAFGVLSLKTAQGYQGQLLISSNKSSGLYWRTGIISSDAISANWLKVLDSNNYTDYTVTKTGTGASGNWGINISGTAATASKISAITSSDNASNSDVWRNVWISYSDNTTGRPAVTSDLVYQTSSKTLKASHFLAEHISKGGKEFQVKYGSTIDMALMIGSGNKNHGLYDYIAGEWMIFADENHNVTVNGNATSATKANITTTANAIAYYSDTTGTFASKASANGALYAASANGVLTWGTLPVPQGGTGTTSFTANSLIMSGTNSTSSLVTRSITSTLDNTNHIPVSSAVKNYVDTLVTQTAQSSYVTLNTEQQVTGRKTFSNLAGASFKPAEGSESCNISYNQSLGALVFSFAN